jgi:hypothetical protein
MMRRRPTQVFSLAFLDCICCGFGAIILIFVLSLSQQDKEKEIMMDKLRQLISGELAALARMNSSKEDMEQSNARVATMVVDQRLKNDSVHALIDELEAQLQHEKRGMEALLVDVDELKKEIAARQKKQPDILALPDAKPLPVGVPIGSNYIAFVFDTSGSMRDPNSGQIWPIALRKFEEVLDAYPAVQGIQVLDGDGRFVLRGDNQWLPDSPETRDAFKRALRRYDIFSESNPTNGLFRALRTLPDPRNENMKMGIYLFGDEFTGVADPVIRTLDQLNPADAEGNRRVTINAVLFPTTIRYEFGMGNTGLKLSNLMREVCYAHGGAMIALQDL